MSSDTYVAVNEEEMSLELYPCGLESGSYIVPCEDIYSTDEDGRQYLYLRQGQRCLVLTGSPKEPEIIWFRICATGTVATWDESIINSFAEAPPKPEISAADLLGKNLLIGINRYDEEDNYLGKECYFGEVIEVTEMLISIVNQETQEPFAIPFAPEAIEESVPGLTFTFDGTSVTGADFISQWTVTSSSEE